MDERAKGLLEVKRGSTCVMVMERELRGKDPPFSNAVGEASDGEGAVRKLAGQRLVTDKGAGGTKNRTQHRSERLEAGGANRRIMRVGSWVIQGNAKPSPRGRPLEFEFRGGRLAHADTPFSATPRAYRLGSSTPQTAMSAIPRSTFYWRSTSVCMLQAARRL